MLMWFVIRAGHWVQSHGSFNHRASSTRETKLKQHIATSLSLICGAQGPAQPIDLFQLQLQMQFSFSVLPPVIRLRIKSKRLWLGVFRFYCIQTHRNATFQPSSSGRDFLLRPHRQKSLHVKPGSQTARRLQLTTPCTAHAGSGCSLGQLRWLLMPAAAPVSVKHLPLTLQRVRVSWDTFRCPCKVGQMPIFLRAPVPYALPLNPATRFSECPKGGG